MTQKLPVVVNMATISDVTTVISLIGKVVKAATDAQVLKKEFKELADYLELLGRQLEMLDDKELGDASMQTFQKMEEVLVQCNDLANSCQQRGSIYHMTKSKRIQNELKGAQEKIAKYLTLIPLIHFTQVFRRFKEEDTQINENWNLNASYESDIPDMENEEVEEAFVTSIAQADRPVCMHQLSANLFTSWTHIAPGRRFWRCKNRNMANDCLYFEWHDPVQENVTIEQMDFVIHQRDELDEEIKMMDEESDILFNKLKTLEEKIAECKRSKEALEMKSKSIDIFYECM